VNPYVPGQPASPDTFAGRTEVLLRLDESLELARRLRRNSAILLNGYRGSGKTSALRKIAFRAVREFPETVAVEVPLRIQSSEDRLLATVVQEVGRQLEGRTGLGDRIKGFLGRINGLAIGGNGVTVGPAAGHRRTSGLSVWRDCVESVQREGILMIGVDDAELLDASGLGALKTISESHGGAPIILAIAGGVELGDRLSQRNTSPIARIFSAGRFDIGEFSLEETREALDAPIRAAGSPATWTAEAADEVHRLSRGYPFLVQCLGYAAFRESAPIDLDRVKSTVDAALKAGGSWLERECASASDEDIRAFAKIADQGRSSLRSSEILSLGVQSPYIGRLVRLRILKKVARGQYELRKAPVIAYYHALARGLRIG
jgi:hypothetical protein